MSPASDVAIWALVATILFHGITYFFKTPNQLNGELSKKIDDVKQELSRKVDEVSDDHHDLAIKLAGALPKLDLLTASIDRLTLRIDRLEPQIRGNHGARSRSEGGRSS